MSAIATELTRLLGIQTPIIVPPMANVSGGSLAAQATIAGGFGFLSAGYDPVEKVQQEIDLANSLITRDSDGRIPIGVGYLVWVLEKMKDNKGLELVKCALDSNVKAVWFSFGDNIGKYVQYVREYDSGSTNKSKTIIFILVSTVEEALVAVNEWNADVLIVQGVEAGGHGLNAGSSPPLLSIFSQIRSVHPNSPPLLAAGGLVNGAHVASMLTLGAAGVVLGTRFLLAPESLYTDAQRKALIHAKSIDAVRTTAFDQARNTLGWPAGIDGRGLRNATVTDYENGEDLEIVRQKFTEGVRKGDPDRMLVWAGTGVGLMDRIQPASEIMHELHAECLSHLKRSSSLLV